MENTTNKKINIVLHEPEIPQNTGNIARTCAATGASLHIIKPMGFTIDDKKLKRAGLDYWDKLDITYYENYADFLEKHPEARGNIFYFTTKAPRSYTEVSPYPDNVFIMFGKETRGLPEEVLYANRDACVRLPMREGLRSLNLSNSVAIAVYEILRQNGFADLKTAGELTQFSWD
jgi:tRNA (cytidine/uridine-2'-O-)-methyltransferase